MQLLRCMPCVPSFHSITISKVSQEKAKDAFLSGLNFLDVQPEIWRKILSQLQPLNLGILCHVSKKMQQYCLQACNIAGSLVVMLGLQGCHVLDAPFISFAWLGAESRLASGADGWETLLGSLPIPHQPRRMKWMLEVVSLRSLLSVGIANENLNSNALLGSKSCSSWGWELHPKGHIEAIASYDNEVSEVKRKKLQLSDVLMHGRVKVAEVGNIFFAFLFFTCCFCVFLLRQKFKACKHVGDFGHFCLFISRVFL